ncbi:MAG: hypothetical protein QME81_18345 [bacterium]|nr:hypothetical protein [bacterium]
MSIRFVICNRNNPQSAICHPQSEQSAIRSLQSGQSVIRNWLLSIVLLVTSAPLLLCSSASLCLANSQVGQGAAKFLDIGIGARGSGLGGGFIALANDGTAMYWNPAGLSLLDRKEVTLMVSSSGDAGNFSADNTGISHNYLSYVHPQLLGDEYGNFGFGFINLGVSEIPLTERERVDGLPQLSGTGDDSEYTFLFSWGKKVYHNQLGIGGSLKFIYQSLIDESTFGYGADLGVLADLSALSGAKDESLLWIMNNLKAGLVMRGGLNLGWGEHTDSKPSSFSLGLAFEPMKSKSFRWTTALAITQIREKPLTLSLGTEFGLANLPVAVRVSIDNWAIEARAEGLELADINLNRRFSFGLGGSFSRFRVDYAMVSENIRSRNQIQVAVRF